MDQHDRSRKLLPLLFDASHARLLLRLRLHRPHPRQMDPARDLQDVHHGLRPADAVLPSVLVAALAQAQALQVTDCFANCKLGRLRDQFDKYYFFGTAVRRKKGSER